MSDVARLVVDTVRSILELSELMKEDLSQFVLGSMSEKQLRAVLMAQAAKQERLEKQKREQEEELYKECTFAPEIHTTATVPQPKGDVVVRGVRSPRNFH